MSGADVASLISAINTRDNSDDFFGDGIWGIIMLLIIAGLFSGDGFGSFGRNKGDGVSMIANDGLLDDEFIKRDIFNTNQNVSNTACQTQRDILENRYNLGSQIQENRFNCSQNACNTQKEILQNRYDNAIQTNALQNQASTNALQAQMQLAECCCNLRAEGISNTQKILDKMCETEVNTLRDKLADRDRDLQTAYNQISQIAQTNNIVNQLRPFPTPSYIVTSPYTSIYNPYNNCGCSGTSLY